MRLIASYCAQSRLDASFLGGECRAEERLEQSLIAPCCALLCLVAPYCGCCTLLHLIAHCFALLRLVVPYCALLRLLVRFPYCDLPRASERAAECLASVIAPYCAGYCILLRLTAPYCGPDAAVPRGSPCLVFVRLVASLRLIASNCVLLRLLLRMVRRHVRSPHHPGPPRHSSLIMSDNG